MAPKWKGRSAIPVGMKRKILAYTLLELMVTLAIVAILASVAVPSYNGMMNNSRQSAALNLFLGELHFARSEAVKRSRQVMVCAANATSDDCSGTDSWDQGWLIFIDDDRDDTFDSGEQLLRIADPVNTRLDFTPSTDVTTRVRYRPNGISLDSGSFTVCDDRGADNAKAVVINVTGRPQVSEKNHTGGTLVCS